MIKTKKFMKKIAKLGGKATLKKYSKNWFRLLARKRWSKKK